MKWLLSLNELHQKNMRSMTEFVSLGLSVYLVGTWLVEDNKNKWNESVIIIKLLLIDKWCGKDESHKLSLILKSSTIIRRFQIFTSVSFRYFKAEWEALEYTFINQKISPLLKNEVRRISLWSIISFWIEKWREESLILM